MRAGCHSTDLQEESIWFGRSWSMTLKTFLDALIYAVLTGGVFGWLANLDLGKVALTVVTTCARSLSCAARLFGTKKRRHCRSRELRPQGPECISA